MVGRDEETRAALRRYLAGDAGRGWHMPVSEGIRFQDGDRIVTATDAQFFAALAEAVGEQSRRRRFERLLGEHPLRGIRPYRDAPDLDSPDPDL